MISSDFDDISIENFTNEKNELEDLLNEGLEIAREYEGTLAPIPMSDSKAVVAFRAMQEGSLVIGNPSASVKIISSAETTSNKGWKDVAFVVPLLLHPRR